MSYVLSENEERLVIVLRPAVQVAPEDAVFVMTDFVDNDRKIPSTGRRCWRTFLYAKKIRLAYDRPAGRVPGH